MYNPGDDNELDRLSKEAAGKFDAPGSANWQAMLDKLDEVLPVEKKRRKFLFFWWLFPALLLGGAGIWVMEKPLSYPITTEKQMPAPVTNKLVAPMISLKNNTIILPKNPVKKIVPNSLDVSSAVATNRKNTVPASMPPTEPIPSQQETKDLLFNIPSAALNSTPDSIEKNSNTAKETATEPIEPAAAIATQTEAKKIKGTRWSIGIIGGVDKSTVKFTYGETPGFNIGILAGYHFNKNWSVHSGAIYTKKNYKMAGEDFTAPKGSWISLYTLESVDGYCRMWEVPVLIRYTMNRKNGKSFFLSAGLSSYFMTDEDYTYAYFYNGQLVARNSSYTSSDTHILSIAHFSAGFEKRISRQFSFLAEPYAKLPLTGIGLGNIKLSSFGVNFSIQFRQPAGK